MPQHQYLTNQKLLKETHIFLASYPRSGNTWMRLLLSDALLQMQGFQTATGGNIILSNSAEAQYLLKNFTQS